MSLSINDERVLAIMCGFMFIGVFFPDILRYYLRYRASQALSCTACGWSG